MDAPRSRWSPSRVGMRGCRTGRTPRSSRRTRRASRAGWLRTPPWTRTAKHGGRDAVSVSTETGPQPAYSCAEAILPARCLVRRARSESATGCGRELRRAAASLTRRKVWRSPRHRPDACRGTASSPSPAHVEAPSPGRSRCACKQGQRRERTLASGDVRLHASLRADRRVGCEWYELGGCEALRARSSSSSSAPSLHLAARRVKRAEGVVQHAQVLDAQ